MDFYRIPPCYIHDLSYRLLLSGKQVFVLELLEPGRDVCSYSNRPLSINLIQFSTFFVATIHFVPSGTPVRNRGQNCLPDAKHCKLFLFQFSPFLVKIGSLEGEIHCIHHSKTVYCIILLFL